MGRSTTPTYRIETTGAGIVGPMAWDAKRLGTPNVISLAQWAAVMNASFAPGGVNYSHGAPVAIQTAKVVKQSSGAVVANWVRNAPMFEVIEVA